MKSRIALQVARKISPCNMALTLCLIFLVLGNINNNYLLQPRSNEDES